MEETSGRSLQCAGEMMGVLLPCQSAPQSSGTPMLHLNIRSPCQILERPGCF